MSGASKESGKAARAALSATKRLYTDLRELKDSRTLPANDTIDDWRRTVSSANKAIALLLALLHAQREQHNVETAVLVQEMRSEFVDREAHAARTEERFRLFVDRDASGASSAATSVSSTAYERAMHSAGQLESTIAQLGCSAHAPGPGTRALSA